MERPGSGKKISQNMITRAKNIHFVGIKGIAMAALAVWAKEAGKRVTGTDVAQHFPSDEVLARAGISVTVGFNEKHIDKYKPDLVIYTGAHDGRDNVEVKRAEALGTPVLPHGKALGMAMEGKRQITVAGSHGKTTVTAMVATILTKAGLDPSYAIGSGMVAGLGLPGHFGRGEWFVAEGDEYVTDPGHDATPRFLWQRPEILVVTNIDLDHPDVYPDIDSIVAAFKKLVSQSGTVIAGSDDPQSAALWGTSILVGSKEANRFHLKVPGHHNAVNAAMAAAAAQAAGVSREKAIAALSQFGGAKRRFEKIGEKDGILYYDDYAHHPAEIRATLEAAREKFAKRRIIVIFQPHTYSRTKALMGEFARSFAEADVVILTDIYPSAREHDTMGITGQTLVSETKIHHKNVHFAQRKHEVQTLLAKRVRSGDVVFFMGAGDIGQWEKEII